jgi:hypothetical protein
MANKAQGSRFKVKKTDVRSQMSDVSRQKQGTRFKVKSAGRLGGLEAGKHKVKLDGSRFTVHG